MFIWIFTGRPALGLIISVQMKYKCSYQTQIVTEKRIKSGEKLEMSRKNMPRKKLLKHLIIKLPRRLITAFKRL